MDHAPGDSPQYGIVHELNLNLWYGEVLDLIGEPDAGKSTVGLVAGLEEKKRQLRGARIAYVIQSAAASFNTAH